MPEFSIPKISPPTITTQLIATSPNISKPELPKISAPNIQKPDLPNLPKIDIQKSELPKPKIPNTPRPKGIEGITSRIKKPNFAAVTIGGIGGLVSTPSGMPSISSLTANLPGASALSSTGNTTDLISKVQNSEIASEIPSTTPLSLPKFGE